MPDVANSSVVHLSQALCVRIAPFFPAYRAPGTSKIPPQNPAELPIDALSWVHAWRIETQLEEPGPVRVMMAKELADTAYPTGLAGYRKLGPALKKHLKRAVYQLAPLGIVAQVKRIVDDALVLIVRRQDQFAASQVGELCLHFKPGAAKTWQGASCAPDAAHFVYEAVGRLNEEPTSTLSASTVFPAAAPPKLLEAYVLVVELASRQDWTLSRVAWLPEHGELWFRGPTGKALTEVRFYFSGSSDKVKAQVCQSTDGNMASLAWKLLRQLSREVLPYV